SRCCAFATGPQEPIRCGPPALAGIRKTPSFRNQGSISRTELRPNNCKKFQCKECVMLKKTLGLLASAAMLLGTSHVASAADMPVKALLSPAPVLTWTGFYLGAHVGAGW